jgi:hypothetical protein
MKLAKTCPDLCCAVTSELFMAHAVHKTAQKSVNRESFHIHNVFWGTPGNL